MIKDKSEKTVQKLLALTQDGEIRWERHRDHLTEATDGVVRCFYSTKIDGVTFIIYSLHYQISPDGLAVYWNDQPKLAIADPDFEQSWEFPYIPAMKDLLRAAETSAAKVEDVLDRVINWDRPR